MPNLHEKIHTQIQFGGSYEVSGNHIVGDAPYRLFPMSDIFVLDFGVCLLFFCIPLDLHQLSGHTRERSLLDAAIVASLSAKQAIVKDMRNLV